MDTFGQCGLPLIVIHNTVIGQESMVIYLDSLRKTELMEYDVFGHVVGRQYMDLEVAYYLKAVSGNGIFYDVVKKLNQKMGLSSVAHFSIYQVGRQCCTTLLTDNTTTLSLLYSHTQD